MSMHERITPAHLSAFARRPKDYKINTDPVIDCDEVQVEELYPTPEEFAGGIVRWMRIVARRSVTIVGERADSIVSSDTFRVRTPDERGIEYATGEARTRVRERLFTRALMGMSANGGRR